jgi:hypothetical protein
MTVDLFSWDGSAANDIQVTMLNSHNRPCLLKDGEVYQTAPGDVITLPADIAAKYIAAGLAV